MGKGLVVGLVALGLVGVGAYVADGFERDKAEDSAAVLLSQRLQVDGTPDVRIDGFPFLPQLLARSLDDVHASARGVQLEGVEVTDVVVDATDVSLDQPYRVGTVRLEATVPTSTVQQLVARRVQVDVAVDGQVLRASGDVFGIPLTAGLVPRVVDGRLQVDVQDVTLGAGELRLEDLPGDVAERLVGIEVPLDGLPAGIALEQAVVVPDGVRFTASGTDVDLERLP
jgi:LmeA-like phospholipid-binding